MLQQVAERLVARGHTVTVLAANGATQREIMSAAGGGLPPTETLNGVSIRRFSPFPATARVFRALTEMRGGWRVAASLTGDAMTMCRRIPNPAGVVRPVLSHTTDVVLALNWIWPPAYGVYLARRLRRFPLVGVPIFHVGRSWTDQPLYRRMLSACDHVVTLTAAEEQFVLARCDRPVSVVGAGVDPAAFAGRNGAALRRSLGLEGAPVVGFVGRQDGLKGAGVLIEAMRGVWRVRPDAVLLLAGQSAHRAEAVQTLLADLPVPHRQRVVELQDFPTSDGPSIVDACDVVVIPSVEESFGLVYLEAWMCAKPVIGAQIPSTACVIDHGVDGLLVEPGESDDLTGAILTLLSDPELRRRMGEQGQRKTLARFTWEAVTDRWEAALRRTVSAGR